MKYVYLKILNIIYKKQTQDDQCQVPWFYFSSHISDLRPEEASNLETPMLQIKAPWQKPSRTANIQTIATLLQTPIKPVTSPLPINSVDWTGSMDFHPHRSIWRGPNTLARVMSEKGKQETLLASKSPPTLSQSVSGDHVGSLDFTPIQ